MKDSYSFDRDEAGLDRELRAAPAGIPARLGAVRRGGLPRRGRERDHGRQRVARLPRPDGARARTSSSLREWRLLRGHRGRARRSLARPTSRSSSPRLKKSRRPASRPSRRWRSYSGSIAAATSKAMPVVVGRDGSCSALVRGDDRLSEEKLDDGLPVRVPARDGRGDPRDVRRRRRLDRPRRLEGGGASRTRRCAEGQFVAGANRDGWHLRGVEARARLPGRGSLTSARRSEGDACPECGGRASFPDCDRGRAHLQARDASTQRRSMPPSSTRTEPRSRSSMGSYGIGPGRVIAAIVEQHHDEHGIALAARRSRPTTCTSSCSPGWRSRRERVAAVARRGAASPSSSTTATCVRARSSRTPT